MSIFDVYDQEFASLSKQISVSISDLRSYSHDGNSLDLTVIPSTAVDDDKAASLMRQIEASLSQAKDLIKQMEIEVRSQDGELINL